MNDQHLTPSLLTFADEERSPLSIRAKALVFIDPRSRQLRDDVDRLARLPIALLIRGESGTGKELLARYVHRESERGGLFVAVSCSAISTTAADAELFGYAAGAHAAALSSRAGWFGSANGGTLYLDEIGDLPLSLQSNLLTALETGEAWRVGATRATPVEPQVLLLDEPFSAVDAFTRMKLHDLIAELAARYEIAVLLVTHDLDEAFLPQRPRADPRRHAKPPAARIGGTSCTTA